MGIILALPGVPGQGILTVLIGVMLLEFPGKRRLERAIVGRPTSSPRSTACGSGSASRP
jgi:hypothetical protein